MPWPKTGATHYNAQLGLLDKGRAIKCVSLYGLKKGKPEGGGLELKLLRLLIYF